VRVMALTERLAVDLSLDGYRVGVVDTATT
jgi:hypothetical protein